MFQYFLFFLVISLSSAFDCTGIDDFECSSFSWNNTFVKTSEERREILQRFYDDFFVDKRDISVIIKNNGKLALKTNENIDINTDILTYDTKRTMVQGTSYIDLNTFINELDYLCQWTPNVKSSTTGSTYLNNRDRMMVLIMMHVANRNDSKLADYFNSLDEDVFSPYLQFGDDELNILKDLNEEYLEVLNRKRDMIRLDFITWKREVVTFTTTQAITTILRYETPHTEIRMADYIFVEYFTNKLVFRQDSEYFFAPFLDIFEEDHTSQTIHGEKDPIIIDSLFKKFTYKAENTFKKGDILKKTARKTLAELFVFDGTFDPNHPKENVFITLHDNLQGDYKASMWHHRLYMYIPFPNYGIYFKNNEEGKLKINLLARIVNMNENEAKICYEKARVIEHNEGLSGLYLIERMAERCTFPNLKIDFRNTAYPLIEDALFKLNRTLAKINKARKNEEKRQNLKRNLDFLELYTKFQYENYESAQNYLESLPWEFKENKIEDLRIKRAKLLSEELEKQKKIDEEIKNKQNIESTETQEPEEPDQELDELIRKSEL